MPNPRPRRVLVIGGGVAGLVTLRNLIKLGEQKGHFDRVELVERRNDVGGVWYLDNPPPNSTTPRWPSPAYPGLIGNVLPEYLSYSDYPPFPTPPGHPEQPFPTLQETYEYLKGFANSLAPGRIRLNTEVVRVVEKDGPVPSKDGGNGWTVVLRDWNEGGKEREEEWDAIVSAVGYYDTPVWPDVPGLDKVREAGLAEHAKAYRGPQGLEGKRILVIGNANSSNDIAAHAAPIAQTPVYRSIRRPALFNFPSLPDPRIKDVAPVREYELIEAEDGAKKVRATLTDGTVIDNIDLVRLGTGYRPFPAFIHVRAHPAVLPSPSTTALPAPSPSTTAAPASLMSPPPSPHRIPALHRHILYAPNPSLAFNGSAMSHTPFTIADITSAWAALAWTGEVAYPESVEERLRSEQERLHDGTLPGAKTDASENVNGTATNGTTPWTSGPSDGLTYNVFGGYEQEYAAGIRADIVKARPELHTVLPEWNDERTRQREAMYALKYKSLEWARNKREAEARARQEAEAKA
ncbi:hypothetical protein GGG16DRAFT_126625 [Schizophyllum commune]